MLGYHTLPLGPDPHWDQAPPRDQTLPPPPAEHTGRYGQRAGGMHPTGMQSYISFCFVQKSLTSSIESAT